MTNDPVLSVRDLRVRRPGGFTLQVENLAIDRHEVLSLIGPNGAGKSTLLQALALVEPAATGSFVLDGAPIGRARLAARRRMAVVLQEPLLLRGSVRDNVALGLRLHGVPKSERNDRVARWLQRTGIEHLAGRSARSLSGGEQRRVSLARALALEPLVLFLDEPFAALDAPGRRALLSALRGWLRDAGCAAVLVTHDRDEAMHLADRVAVILGGAIRQYGPIDAVFGQPADVEVARFLGFENIIPATVCGSHQNGVRVRAGTKQLIADGSHSPGDMLLAIHPEQVSLVRSDERGTSAAFNSIVCQVEQIEPEGSQFRVQLWAGFPLIALAPRSLVAELGLQPGSTVTASMKATALHLLPVVPGTRDAPMREQSLPR